VTPVRGFLFLEDEGDSGDVDFMPVPCGADAGRVKRKRLTTGPLRDQSLAAMQRPMSVNIQEDSNDTSGYD
jgi:hypothetical protein